LSKEKYKKKQKLGIKIKIKAKNRKIEKYQKLPKKEIIEKF